MNGVTPSTPLFVGWGHVTRRRARPVTRRWRSFNFCDAWVMGFYYGRMRRELIDWWMRFID